jgi:hypothetical protein
VAKLVREVSVKTLSVLQKQLMRELSFPLVERKRRNWSTSQDIFLSSSIQVFPGLSFTFFMKKRDELDAALALTPSFIPTSKQKRK